MFKRRRIGTVSTNMGRSNLGRQGMASKQIVAFDFDGTLSVRDSFLAFLAWRSGPLAYAAGLASLAPQAVGYLVNPDRGRIKAAAVRAFLRGLGRDELAQACAAFAASDQGVRIIRPDAEASWRRWRGDGALLAIVTASPEDVVAPFAARLGADVLIGTRLAFDDAGRVTGAFDGANCRGVEKVRRLQDQFGPDVRLAAAYGDTAGDREMLAIAEVQGYRVFTARH